MSGRVLAWALYDLANTFFAIAMLSFHFPLWIVEDRGGTPLAFSVAIGASMGCVALIMPFCGALSDAGRAWTKGLRWTTYACAAATACVAAAPSLTTALALFVFANMAYQLGTIFYDALLWQVAPPGQLASVSSIGAAFGYLGSAVGLLVLSAVSAWGGRAAAFPAAAFCFLLFAWPSFLTLADPPPPAARPAWSAVWREAISRFRHTVGYAKSLAGLWQYLWAAFFSLNAINTVLVFMGVYAKQRMRLAEGDMVRFFVFSQIFAILGALVFGRYSIRWGGKRTLMRIWVGWMAALTLLAARPTLAGLWVAGPVIGFCLGSTWATGRVLLVQLAPKDRLAELFGLAGVFARASAIVGPIVWGALIGPRGEHTELGLLWLLALLAIGLSLLRQVPEASPA